MTPSPQHSKITHADAYPVVRLSEKRLEQSPYVERWRSNEVIFASYANRLYPVTIGMDGLADYWKLRRGVVLYDVPEKPLSIEGPDARVLLERVLTRPIADLKVWHCRYGIACAPDGGILMDGVVIRLGEDHFWYVQADGDIVNWMLAHSVAMDATVSDPGSRVLQIQGPAALNVLAAASGAAVPEDFAYFRAGMFDLGGQDVLVSRTGWTGEMGIEIYGRPDLDHLRLWDHLMASGEPFAMTMAAGDSMGPRRLEAGILDNGTDIDRTMTPFEAGLGAFVDFDNPGFIGRAALEVADRTCLLHGLTSPTTIPSTGDKVVADGVVAGHVTVGDWSPTLQAGIGYVRFGAPAVGADDWVGSTVELRGQAGLDHTAEVVRLPFYDAEKRIPRGLSPR